MTNEPTITCPHCQSEIKLTESLAAPLIQATQKQYEQAIAQKESEIAKREAAIRTQQNDLVREKASLEEQVAARITTAQRSRQRK